MKYSPILLVHICTAIIGLLSGAAAMSFRKGSRPHCLAGNVFFVSMLCMSGAGAYLALMKPARGSVIAGVFTFYLVSTGWSAARRRDGETGMFDWAARLVALDAGVAGGTFGFQSANSQTGLIDGAPAPPYFVFGFMALLCAASDVRMLLHGGVFGARRIARHLWRMCFALLIAAVSFFPGQVKLFPASVRAIKILYAPHLLLIALLIFWLFRVRFGKAYRRTQPVTADHSPLAFQVDR